MIGKTLLVVMLLTSPLAALAAEPTDTRTYADEDYGFSLHAPAGWARSNPAGYLVPGEICRSWSPDGKASLLIFMQHSSESPVPQALLTTSVDAVKSAFAARIVTQEVRTVAGMQAMWLVFTANGTGMALGPKGEVPTTQHWVAIPRQRDVIVLLLTAPESDFAAFETAFTTALASLQVSGAQTDEQRASQPKAPGAGR